MRSLICLKSISERTILGICFNSFLCKRIFLLFFYLCTVGYEAKSQVVYQHDFGTVTITTYPYITNPVFLDSNLNNSGWTNSKGIWTSYAGSSGQAIALSNSSGVPTIALTFEVAGGYQLTIEKFNFWSQRSSTGATDWAMTINGINAGAGTVPTTGVPLGNTNVTNIISGLTGTITVQISLSGASGSGTFRLDDFTLIGSVTTVQTYYRSRQNGNWSSPSTWEYSTDNVNWYVSSKSPTKDAENILIQPGHTINVATSVSLDQTTIAGILELQAGGVLNINDGVGDDIIIPSNGVLKITSTSDYATSVQQSATANIKITSGGKITIGNGSSSTGNGYETFATLPTNVWNDASVFEYNNNGVFQIADLTYFPNASAAITPVFSVIKVNGTAAAGAGKDFYLNGLLKISTDVTFSGSGKKYFRNGIKGTATLTQLNAGKFYLNATNAVLDGASLNLVLTQPIDLGSNAIVPTGALVTVSGSNMSNTAGTLTVNGTLDMTTSTITNSSGFVIINGKYRTANVGGFSGIGSSIPSASGNITVNSGSTIEFYADANQFFYKRDDFSNLIFSGSGIKSPSDGFTPAGTVTIKDNAVFDCSGRNIGDGTPSGATATNLTMTGNSRLIVDTYGPNPMMAGTYNLSGGVIEFKGSNGTAETIRSKNYQNIEVTGNNVSMSDGNITLNNNGTFTIKTGGVFTINDNTINGTTGGVQTVTVKSGGYFKCGTNMGFNGATITSIPIKSSAVNSDVENIILEPNSTVDYSRSGVQPDQPITNAGGLVYQNLVISGSGNKTAPSDNLIIQGNLSKTTDGSFVHNNGTVILNGSNFQTYSCGSPQMVFNNLTNQNTIGLNINDSLSVYNQLALKDNSVINLNADISLLSSKAYTASIGQLGTNVNINYNNGRFIVERYINTNTKDGGHLKGWQFLSTPAFGETIFNTWQEKGSTIISGYGTWITDNSGTVNGFDAVSLAPSMKYYDAASNTWIGISGTNTNLENEKGYMIFVRGDRKATNTSSAANPTVLRTRGKLYTPNAVPPISIIPASKFQSVGNPYASVIDFSKINSTNIQSSYTAWDPTLGGTYGLGGYQTISAAIGYQAVPGNTSIYNTTSDYRNIQSGQAFFVFNYTSLEGSVSFNEACKMSDNQHLINREPEGEKVILFANLISKNGILVDGNAVSFSPYFSNKIDGNDALKISAGGENFSLQRDDKMLAVEAREPIKGVDTIFYNLNNLSKQEYRLAFISQNIHTGFDAYLVDQYLQTETQISLFDSSFINFSVTTDKASANANRFYIVFRAAAAPLSVSFLSINAYPKDGNVRIEWEVENENDVKNYEVEYSTDGIHFSKLGTIPSLNTLANNYSFVHQQPLPGTGYYRLMINKLNGETGYKKILKVYIPEPATLIGVYPNPVEDGIIKLKFINQPIGKYRFNLFNSIGQRIATKDIIYEGGDILQTFKPDVDFIQGIYNLEILRPNGDIKTLKVWK